MFTFRLCAGVGDVGPVEQDAALGRLLESGDHAERRRLPAAGRPEQGEELPPGDLEVDVVDRRHLGEPLGQTDETYLSACHLASDVQGPHDGLSGCRSPRVKARQTRKPAVTDASERSIMIVAMAFVDGAAPRGWRCRS